MFFLVCGLLLLLILEMEIEAQICLDMLLEIGKVLFLQAGIHSPISRSVQSSYGSVSQNFLQVLQSVRAEGIPLYIQVGGQHSVSWRK